jgi:hypothetical protein
MKQPSKWHPYLDKAKELLEEDPSLIGHWSVIAGKLLDIPDGEKNKDKDLLRMYLKRKLKVKHPQNKNFSAIKPDGTLMNIYEWCDTYGIPQKQAKSYKLVTHTGIPYYNIQSASGVGVSESELIDRLKEFAEAYAPNYKKIKRKPVSDPHCLVIDPADVHIGKLCSKFETGSDYNQQIAVQRVHEGVDGILSKSSSFNIDKIIFIAGNDILHTDKPNRTTTSGTPQDTDGMWYENFVNAKRLLIDVIEKLVQVADVEVVYNPSNHDYMSGFMLVQAVSSWFHKHKNVTFNDNMAHRKYTVYGKNLIGSTHGDGAKKQDLPMLMVHEASEHWHECKHRYIYTHHIHHKESKDFMSVCVEALRSPSGTDSWHHRNGYEFAPKAIEGFIHHKKHGQVARLTHLF